MHYMSLERGTRFAEETCSSITLKSVPEVTLQK